MSPLEIWLRSTSLAALMHTRWAWPIAESFHFFGLCLLMGTVGLFDLRLLGFAKRIPLAALHRLIPWGILGYFINVLSGISFFTADPDQYLYNPSFQIKMVFMSLAGINVVLFYVTMSVKSGFVAPAKTLHCRQESWAALHWRSGSAS